MSRNALSTVLAELRVAGAIVLSQAHPIPWAIEVPRGNSLRKYLGVGDDVMVVPFHIAHRGHFELKPANGESMLVGANQLIMCANGHGHIMSSGTTNELHSFEQVMSAGSHLSNATQIGHTEVVCGVFMLRNTKHNPLLMALPNFVLVDVSGANSTPTMQQLHAMLQDELGVSRQGQSYMLERVLELMYAESIRIYTEQQHNKAPSWLTAINDVRVGPAINYIHANLCEPLSVAQLAAEVALSPSRFAACFKELVGVSPQVYVTAQRQSLAARRLLESENSIKTIALECGYNSMPSFTKSFTKQFGDSPTAWRNANRVKHNKTD